MTTTQTDTMSARSKDRETNSHSAMDDLKRDTAAVREDLSVLKDDAVKATSHAAEHATSTVKEYHSNVCETIRKNPTTSVLVAAGIGVIVGKIISKF
ncbi:MAG: hypothetical protein LAT64_14285 [Phycisphaerales bacterium]|nr:hypothetical protein [Planctomycetota bacterium]MCH8509920.1 hypothetical protein [Phycisphaerales bacterium]